MNEETVLKVSKILFFFALTLLTIMITKLFT